MSFALKDKVKVVNDNLHPQLNGKVGVVVVMYPSDMGIIVEFNNTEVYWVPIKNLEKV